MKASSAIQERMSKMERALSAVVRGQKTTVEQVLTCFLAGGHVLIEGVPGLGKTLLAKTLARLADAEFRRIQFTPDLLPSDIIGTNIYDAATGSFSLHRGPIFTEILLADEVNRTPPKSQAALLEAMEERQVTIDGARNDLSELFFVMATQNPVEYEGTYPLPETQLDRFMMKVIIDYPPAEAELEVMRSYAEGRDLHDLDAAALQPIISKKELLAIRKAIIKIVVREDILAYMRNLTAETRDTGYVQLGASTRAGVALLKASRALAALRGMEFVTPDEVKDVALPVLRHRTILLPEAIIDGLTADYFVEDILRRVPVPR